MTLSLTERDLRRRGIAPRLLNGEGRIGNGQLVIVPEANPLSQEQFNAQKVLIQSLTRQKTLMISGRYDQFKNKTDDAFFAVFRKDPLFTQVYELAKAEVFRFTDDWDFASGLRGELVEKMGLAHLSATADDEIPITGKDAFNVVRSLAPNNRVLHYPFDHQTVSGIYTPDGFKGVLKTGRVVETIEYTSGTMKAKGKNGENQLSGQKELVDRLGDVADHPLFTVVSPDHERGVDILCDEEHVMMGWISRLPFSSAAFTKIFEPYVYFKHREHEGALTLAELRQKWHKSTAGQQHATGEPSLFQKQASNLL